jgi:MFS family permease
MNGILRVPRTRGVLSGLLLVLLGAWGALVPFVGPYFHYAYTPDTAWSYTTGRLWLEILPGAGAVLGGLIVLVSAYRPAAHLGAWLAALSGAWFALGSIVGPTWSGMRMSPGTPVGGSGMRALEQIGFFTGLGVVIVLLAAMVLGRFSVISVRDARRTEREARQAERAAKRAERTAPSPRTEPNTAASTAGASTSGSSSAGSRLTSPFRIRRKAAADESTGDTEKVDSATASR